MADTRLRWGNRYVYRLYGFDGEGGPSGASREFELTLPNHHSPQNVQVQQNGSLNTVSWQRTAVDEQDGKTTYYVYGSYGGHNFQELGGSVQGTTYDHSHGNTDWEYAVRARHENYGWTVAAFVGDDDGSGGPPGEVGPSDTITYQALPIGGGFRLLEGLNDISELAAWSTGTTLYMLARNDNDYLAAGKLAGAGSEWSAVGNSFGLEEQVRFRVNGVSIAAAPGEGHVYVAGRKTSGAAPAVYKLNDSNGWNEIQSYSGDRIAVGIHADEVYAAVLQSSEITVRKKPVTGGSFATVGSTLSASGTWHMGFTVLNNNLFLSWEDSNQIHVYSLNTNGDGWVKELEWETSLGFTGRRHDLAWMGGELYIMTHAGVFRRTGMNTAVDARPDGATWGFGTAMPASMTVSPDGKLVVVHGNSNDSPVISVYDGTNWKKITGVALGVGTWPVNVSTVGDHLIYTFTSTSDGRNLESFRLTPE